MKHITVKAVYENGVLKLEEPLPLAEQERVSVTVHIGPSRAQQTAGLVQWTGSVEDLDYLINSPEEGP
jgi:predicted DNA-binding antitoxin AbrB/MazE fold protein